MDLVARRMVEELLRHADVGSPLLYHRGRYAGLADTTDPGDRRSAA